MRSVRAVRLAWLVAAQAGPAAARRQQPRLAHRENLRVARQDFQRRPGEVARPTGLRRRQGRIAQHREDSGRGASEAFQGTEVGGGHLAGERQPSLDSIQTAGTGRISQDGRSTELHPGDFALYDSTRPYELAFDDDFQQYVLMLPGPTLRFSAFPDELPLQAPFLGEHNEEVLVRYLGMGADEVRALERDGVLFEGAQLKGRV